MKVKVDSLKSTNERLADQLRGEQLKKEEELSRNLLLEEQVCSHAGHCKPCHIIELVCKYFRSVVVKHFVRM